MGNQTKSTIRKLKTMTEIKELTTQELEAELLERHRRDQPGKINSLRNVVALRNQLLSEVKKSVEYNEKVGMIRMLKKDYDILFNDYENTTKN
jgi:uncharacterized protein YeeX (DUF496 family)